MSVEQRFMARAIELARGPLRTSPNPRVGCVLVRDESILSEGFHAGVGSRHAEAVALDGIDASGATLYVNLEPCAHQGNTPPCAPAIVDAGVSHVVVAHSDPDARVGGRGLDLLRTNGVKVDVGLLEQEARELNRSYLHHRTTGLPFVTLKLAQTIDGRIATRDGSSKWISDEDARHAVHRLRASSDAIVVGAGTVIADDPQLTARGLGEVAQPVRVIVDAKGRVPAAAAVFAGPGTTIVATTGDIDHDSAIAYKETGAEVLTLPASTQGVDLAALMTALGERGFVDVLVEGGAALATSLLTTELVHRFTAHVGNVIAGDGPSLGDVGISTMADAPRWKLDEVDRTTSTAMLTYLRSVD